MYLITGSTTETNLALSTTLMTRQPPPFESYCTKDYPSNLTDVIPETIIYSQSLCNRKCLLRYVRSRCGW